MTYTTDKQTEEALKKFRQFDADTQLALLWFGYLDLKDELNPGEGPSVSQPAQALYDQIQNLPKDQQLEAQRDIVACRDSQFTQAYNALASSARLELWLLLGQGMERGEIVNLPAGYKLPDNTNEFTNQIKQLSFEQRINFSRSAVVDMGTAKQEGKRV